VFGGTLNENKATPRNELVVQIHLGNNLDTRRDAHSERTLLHAHSSCEENTTVQLQKELMVLLMLIVFIGQTARKSAVALGVANAVIQSN